MSCAFFHFPLVVFPGSFSMLSTKKYMELSIQLYLNSFILVKFEINSIIIRWWRLALNSPSACSENTYLWYKLEKGQAL